MRIRVRRLLLLGAWAIALGGPTAAAQPVETELPGVTAELIELRQANGALRLAVRFTNGGTATADARRFPVDRIVLVDAKSKKKYLPMKAADGLFVGGPLGDSLDGGRIAVLIPPQQSTIVWAYFDPLPAGTVVSVQVPYAFPFDDVPVTEGTTGKVLSPTAARSTPTGATATVVAARRSADTLSVRLRVAADAGAKVALGGSYFEFKNVFLFDPASKRKYPVLKGADGFFQATPLGVKSDGGSFIYEWSRATLVSLTFPPLPDSVLSVDLFLPRFLPFEAVRLQGSGAAAGGGGIAVSGTAVDLEGALKELKASVTASEIKIDLAADVLFEYDKADIKPAAEASLRHVATVLKANPGAQVAIDGHTDAKGADAYNQVLSEKRAASVKQWLVASAELDGGRIATRGWGKTKPAAPNARPDGSDDPDGRAKNRRVEIVVRKAGG